MFQWRRKIFLLYEKNDILFICLEILLSIDSLERISSQLRKQRKYCEKRHTSSRSSYIFIAHRLLDDTLLNMDKNLLLNKILF